MLCDFCQLYYTHWCFLGGSAVKNPPPMQETWIRSLSWEDPLEKEMATHSSVLACKKFLLLLNWGAWRAAVHRITGGESWTQLATTPPPPPPPPYTHVFLNSVKMKNNLIGLQKWSLKNLAKIFYSLSQLPQKSHYYFNFFKHGIFFSIIIILKFQVSEIIQYALLLVFKNQFRVCGGVSTCQW